MVAKIAPEKSMFTFLTSIKMEITPEQWIGQLTKINLHLGQTPQNAEQILKHLLVESGIKKE